MDTVAIILVHYNTEVETRNCLKSLLDLKHVGFQYKVIVVDNASKQPFALPKALQTKNVEVIRSEKNLGFTGGNNLGIWYARQHYQPAYILFLNNDTTVDSHFLEHLYEVAKDDLQVGMVTAKIYFSAGQEFHHDDYLTNERGNVLWYTGGSIDWLNLTAFHKGVDEVDRGQFDQKEQTEFATGCCMLVPTSVLDRVGTLDKNFFLYLEDVDLSMRVIQQGYKIIYQPLSKVWHVNAGSTGGAGSGLHQYYQTRNRLYFTFKHGTTRHKQTALRLAAQFMFKGNSYQRRAVWDLVLGRLGKQPIH